MEHPLEQFSLEQSPSSSIQKQCADRIVVIGAGINGLVAANDEEKRR